MTPLPEPGRKPDLFSDRPAQANFPLAVVTRGGWPRTVAFPEAKCPLRGEAESEPALTSDGQRRSPAEHESATPSRKDLRRILRDPQTSDRDKNRTILAYLLSRSRLAPTGCLEWTGPRVGDGYGRIRLAGRGWQTHRIAWTLAHGPIPDGLFVCHHCDNPPCMQTEPDERFPEGHLFLGTNADNLADARAKGRMPYAVPAEVIHLAAMKRLRKTHCRNGHEWATHGWQSTEGRRCRVCSAATCARWRARRDAKLTASVPRSGSVRSMRGEKT